MTRNRTPRNAPAKAAELQPRRQTVRLLGRDIPVLAAGDGTLRADDDGKPASSKSVQAYIARAFGDRLVEARAAMDALAASVPPEKFWLNSNRLGAMWCGYAPRFCTTPKAYP